MVTFVILQVDGHTAVLLILFIYFDASVPVIARPEALCFQTACPSVCPIFVNTISEDGLEGISFRLGT